MKKIILHFSLVAAFAACKCCAETPETAQSQIAAIKAKLNQIILPGFAIAEASFEESIEYLRLKSRELDTQADPTRRGVNFVIIGKAAEKKGNSLGLSMKNVPLSEVINGTADQYEMKNVVEPHAVVFCPKKHQMLNPVPIQKATSELEIRLQKIIRPTIQFQDATIEEAVECLRISNACLDAYGDFPRSVNILLKTNQAKPSPLISLDLKNVSQGEALRYVAEIAGLKIQYQSHAVVISPMDEPLAGKIVIESKGLAKVHADKIIMPHVTLENVTMREAFEYIRLKTRDLDPEQKGTTVISSVGVELDKIVDMELKTIPVSEVLRYCAELTGHTVTANDDAFVFSVK